MRKAVGVEPPRFMLSRRNAIRFSEARLHAVSSRKLYSEHGFEALIRPLSGQVCHSLIVVSNCRPGSAEAQAAWPIRSHNSRAGNLLATLPSVRRVRLPGAVGRDAVEELVRDPHRIVRILPGDRQIAPRNPNRCRRCGSRSRYSPGGRTGSPAGCSFPGSSRGGRRGSRASMPGSAPGRRGRRACGC